MDIFYYIVQQMWVSVIPLLIVALAGLYAERSGIINIALEGIMLMGALAGITFIHLFNHAMPPQLLLIVSMIIAGVVGLLFSAFHAFASINMKADQTISGTALNIFAPAFCIFFGRLIIGTQQITFENLFRFDKIPLLGDIPFIGDLLFKNSYLSTYIGLAILVITYIVMYKTKFGLRLRACGDMPHAADSAGINVYKMRWAGTLISGFLAGMGGLVFIIPTSSIFNGNVSGFGFLALAVLIFGQWHPSKIFFAAVFFGFMRTFSAIYADIPFIKDIAIPAAFYKMIPYIATLIVLAFTSKNSAAPRAEGEPFDKGKR